MSLFLGWCSFYRLDSHSKLKWDKKSFFPPDAFVLFLYSILLFLTVTVDLIMWKIWIPQENAKKVKIILLFFCYL